jgi:H+-translocating NAD(P) transhydrogenase subunit beta
MAADQLLSPNQVALLYLVASVLFILALRGLSHPLSARQGNRFGIAGMVIAVLVTFAMTQSVALSLVGLVIGGLVGWYAAKRVEMTQMPELVAAMHSLVNCSSARWSA